MGPDDTPLITYSRDLLLKLFQPTHLVSRPTCKALFAAGLWRPYIGRLYACLRVMWPQTPPPDLSSDPAPPPAQPQPSSSSLRQGLRVATWNIHSMRKKYVAVSDAILSHELDLLVVTESWHQAATDVSVLRSIPLEYTILDRPRPDSSGYGGIIIYHRASLRVKPIALTSAPSTFEALAVSVMSAHGPYTVLAVYRPGSSHPTSAFFEEFTSVLKQFALYNTQIVVL